MPAFYLPVLHGPPQAPHDWPQPIILLAADFHKDLIQMPNVECPATALANPAAVFAPKFLSPTAHCLVPDINPALGQQFLNITLAHGEAEMEPNS